MELFNYEFSNSSINNVYSFGNQTDKEEFDFNSYGSNKEIEEHIMTDHSLFFHETGFTPNNILTPVLSSFTDNINKINLPSINNIEEEKNEKDECILTQKKRKQVDKNKESLMIKKCGRKIKVSNETGKHNKYSDDNITRKIKSKTIKKIIIYMNNIINKKKYKLLFLSSEQVKKSKVDYNKKLINKTIKEILSTNQSGKYINYEPQHNKHIIEKLLKEEDEDKRNTYESLFSLTLLDCIKHLRGDIYIKALSGIGSLDDMIHDLNGEEDEYKQIFKDYFLNFETKINEKKGRNRIKWN